MPSNQILRETLKKKNARIAELEARVAEMEVRVAEMERVADIVVVSSAAHQEEIAECAATAEDIETVTLSEIEPVHVPAPEPAPAPALAQSDAVQAKKKKKHWSLW